QERQRLTEQTQSVHSTWRAQQEQAHPRELSVNELRHRRDALAGRLREDYQPDLAELYAQRLATEVTDDKETSKGVTLVPGETATPGAAASSSSPSVSSVFSVADPAQIHEEIAELKRKLSKLGSVNLDALQELADLELRAGTLQAQFDDLTAAKKALEEIIAK